MSIPIQVSVGPQGISLQDGAIQTARGGRTGEMVVSELNARYFELLYRGRVWHASNQAAQAVSVALATTYTGIGLYNPTGSSKLLVPLKIKFAMSVAQVAIATQGLIQAWAATGAVTAQTTSITPQNGLIGNTSRPVGIALSAATITTPTWLTQQIDGFTAAALSAPTLPLDYEGTVGVLPGGFIGIGALTTVTGLGWISWAEVDYTQ